MFSPSFRREVIVFKCRRWRVESDSRGSIVALPKNNWTRWQNDPILYYFFETTLGQIHRGPQANRHPSSMWLQNQDLNLTGVVGHGEKPQLEQVFLSLKIHSTESPAESEPVNKPRSTARRLRDVLQSILHLWEVVIYLTQVDTTCSMAGYGGIPAEPERV